MRFTPKRPAFLLYPAYCILFSALIVFIAHPLTPNTSAQAATWFDVSGTFSGELVEEDPFLGAPCEVPGKWDISGRVGFLVNFTGPSTLDVFHYYGEATGTVTQHPVRCCFFDPVIGVEVCCVYGCEVNDFFFGLFFGDTGSVSGDTINLTVTYSGYSRSGDASVTLTRSGNKLTGGSTASPNPGVTVSISFDLNLEEILIECTDNDGDGYFSMFGCGTAIDCNDNDPAIHPGASEVCNDGIDNDCDGLVDCDDPDCPPPCSSEVCNNGLDDDGDGLVDCDDPECMFDNDGDGYFALPCGSDCNDNDANEHPGQTWYKDADGDGYSDGTTDTTSCTRPSGFKLTSELTATSGDCNDNNASINPEATEVCNGVDDDCDELIDIGTGNTYYGDADGDGYGDPNSLFKACTQPSGFVSNNSDCNDNNANIHPGAIEVCNVVDDNCNGQIDEGVTKNIYYRDADGDGYGNPNNSTQACSPPSGFVSNNQDCNDGDSSIHPGAPEVCDDSKDNDCDGRVDCIDPDCQVWVDNDMDGCPGPPCGNDCRDDDPFICPSLPEDCLDGKDNDCDGFVDCADNDCRIDQDDDKCFAPPCGQDCKDNDPSSCICPEEVLYKVPSYIDFRRIGVITLPIPRPVRFRDELNLDFCEALGEGVEEVALELSGCEPITIHGDRLKSDRLKNRFSARSSSGEIPGYSLNINCKKGLLKLQIWNADLENCVSNPVRTCVTIKDGPSLCAEDEFKEVRDRKGRLKKLVYTGK